ncbi:MAG: hypothetical protein JWM96_423, partial [Alphaproteobacteria bacterium]|nr:hypothetical protein [Alphaproteobacteria bacterium]
MKIEKALNRTYPLLIKPLRHCVLDFNDQEAHAAQRVQKVFINYTTQYNQNLLSMKKQKPAFCADAIHELTEKSLRDDNPKVALIGLVYQQEMNKELRDLGSRRICTAFRESNQNFFEFFRHLRYDDCTADIKKTAAKLCYNQNKHMTE